MNKWYTAFPPLHDCDDGIGNGDNFAKTMLDSVREDISIGLIPCAFSGQSTNIFKKGNQTNIADWLNYDLFKMSPVSIYDWMVERCKIAQESGIIKGILLHQGETDSNAGWWVGTTKEIFNNLKSDLSLDDEIPILVGELLQDAGACCAAHNQSVHQLASEYDHCEYVSSEGLKMLPGDSWRAHFDCEGHKVFGKRYAEKLLEMTDNDYIPRRGTTVTSGKLKRVKNQSIVWDKEVTIYSLDGSVVAILGNKRDFTALRKLVSGKVYLASQNGNTGANVAVVPFVNN